MEEEGTSGLYPMDLFGTENNKMRQEELPQRGFRLWVGDASQGLYDPCNLQEGRPNASAGEWLMHCKYFLEWQGSKRANSKSKKERRTAGEDTWA